MTDENITVTVPPPLPKIEAALNAEAHSILSKLEAQLAAIPDYLAERVKATIAELRAAL